MPVGGLVVHEEEEHAAPDPTSVRGSNAKRCGVCCLRGRRSPSSRAAGQASAAQRRAGAEGSLADCRRLWSPELPGEFCLVKVCLVGSGRFCVFWCG